MKNIEERVFNKIRIKCQSKNRNRYITAVDAISNIEDVKEFLASLMEELVEKQL